MKKQCLLLLVLCAFLNPVFSQITGTVTDEKGKKLPYVSVYVKNTIIGTTTNNNGFYQLELNEKGTHHLVFQFLGYKTITKTVLITSFPHQLNVQMQTQEIILDEVEVSSEKNPANAIIRKAIDYKKNNTKHLNNFTADFYSKGLMRVKNAPKKFMGQDVNFPFPLDSTRSGVIYLSETVSKIKYQKKPRQFKEHIVASKKSGSDNGVSFNQADEVNFNLYENSVTIAQSKIISPISDFAFTNYKYKLAGTFYDENGNLINKIKLIPKRKNDRVFGGFIYIAEDIWAVYGAELTLNGNQFGNPAVKKLKIKQNYRYVKSYKTWSLNVQTVDFKAGMFGFNFTGRFSASYSNYNLNPSFDKKTFTNEILSFDKNATKKDSVFWNKLRPIPLTIEEREDYKIKDSIKVIKKSKKYLDSVDLKNNKFKLSKLVLGYSYQNSYKKWTAGANSPLLAISFNTVQGWNVNLNGYFFKKINEKGKWYRINGNVNYGLSEKKWRPKIGFTYRYNDISKPTLNLSTGFSINQFNDRSPISKLNNTISSVFFKRNYMKLYEKQFAEVIFGRDIFNGVRLFSSIEYAKRSPLKNTSKYTMFSYKNRKYTSNNPIDAESLIPVFSKHSVWKAQITAKINFGNKYLSLPDKKIDVGNKKYPTLYLGYRKIFGAKNKNFNSDLFLSKLEQSINLGNRGNFNYMIRSGIFAQKKNIPFMDYLHPKGNRFEIAPSYSNYTDSFNLLNYYTLSSNIRYSEWHTEHNFKGFILSRIPLLNKLNFHLVAGAKALFTPKNKPYYEYNVGLDNIGFGKWRFLRIDYVHSYFGRVQENGILFGVNLLN